MPLRPISIAALFSQTARWWVAAVLVMAALIVPWMSAIHPAPLADWLTDALTLSGIALAALVPLKQASERVLTRTGIFAWAMVMLSVILGLIHRPAYPSQVWAPAGTFLAMVLLAGTVRDLTGTPEDRERFFDVLAAALLLSATLQSLIGFLQYIGQADILGMWIAHQPGEKTMQVMGNICQRNVFADMLGVGVASACWLFARRRLPVWGLAVLVPFIALLMAWCGARLVLAYGAGFLVLPLVWWLRARGDAMVRRFCYAAWFSGAVVLGMQWGAVWVAHTLWDAFGVGTVPDSGFGRLFEVSPTARRWSEWSKALEGFAHHPILGLGWGGLPPHSAASEAFDNFIKAPDNTLCLHAHNLVVQLLAETGLVGALVGVGGIAWCLWPSVRRAKADSLFVLCAVMMPLTHSQFEYPLWYITGLATFVVLLACASPEPLAASAFKPIARRFGAVVMSALLLAHAITGWFAFVAVVQGFGSTPDRWTPELGQKLYTLQSHPLWAAEADLVVTIHLIAWGEPIKPKLELLERQAAYRPYGPVLFKLAVLRAISGDEKRALEAVDIFTAGFPDLVKPFLDYSQQIPEPAIAPVKKRMADWLAAREVAKPKP